MDSVQRSGIVWVPVPGFQALSPEIPNESPSQDTSGIDNIGFTEPVLWNAERYFSAPQNHTLGTQRFKGADSLHEHFTRLLSNRVGLNLDPVPWMK